MRSTKKVHRHPQPTIEVQEILRLAMSWAPYGGIPSDEVFCRFGVDQTRFSELLWRTVREYGCDKEALAVIQRVYPHTASSKETIRR